MKKIKLSNIPTKSLIFFLVFSSGIVSFYFLAILPIKTTSEELDYKLTEMHTKIEEQKILAPVYKNLLKKAQLKQPEEFSELVKVKLSRSDTKKISSIIKKIASKTNMKITAFKPDVESLISESGHLLINIVLTGDFLNFHGFLFQLCRLPALEQIENIEIRSIVETNEFKIRLFMAHE